MSGSSSTAAAAPPRPKMSYACEACRTSKVKCLTSPQPGICKRCADSKRECVFRTGPRTRRPKYPEPSDAPPRPPPGPSKTFSIDFSMPADDVATAAPDEILDGIRAHHERMLEDLVPTPSSGGDERGGANDEDNPGSATTASISASASAPAPAPASDSRGTGAGEETFDFNDLSAATPSSATTASLSSGSSRDKQRQRSLLGGSLLGVKPQFNLDSAERMLATFRADMLPHCPLVALPPGADVRSLQWLISSKVARTAPFVLLAILAVASHSTSPQGHSHSLYDEEFRKVLGLKFVAASERSLEMLQGLLIYCTWYPFHLRSKQAYKYFRMSVDVVQDLELDQESSCGDDYEPFRRNPLDGRRLPEIRAFLACFYLVSSHSGSWDKSATMRWDSWVARCCDVLEQPDNANDNDNVSLDEDRTLVGLVRLQHIATDINELNRSCRRKAVAGTGTGTGTGTAAEPASEHHNKLIRLGLETQLREWQNAIPERIATMPSITMASLFVDVYLVAEPLVFMRRYYNNINSNNQSNNNIRSRRSETTASVDPDKLLAAMRPLRALLDHAAALPAKQRAGLCVADWGRIIVALIVAFRCSFPLPSSILCSTSSRLSGWSPSCSFDWERARRILDLGAHLEKLADGEDGGNSSENSNCGGNGGGRRAPERQEGNEGCDGDGGGGGDNGDDHRRRKVDVSTPAVMKVVLRSVKAKFDKKIAAFDAAAAAAHAAAIAAASAHANNAFANGDMEEQSRVSIEVCPMFNGTLSQYLSTWEGQQQRQPPPGSFTHDFGCSTAPSSLSLSHGAMSSQSVGSEGVGLGMEDLSSAAAADYPGAARPAPYDDLWAAMTRGWATDPPADIGLDLMGGGGSRYDAYPEL